MIKVSVVEDVTIMREALIRIIREDPALIFVSEHSTFEDAQSRLPAYEPDIVLLDIDLAGENGIELIAKVHEFNSAMEFLVCTVFQDDAKIFEALKAGALGYILKKSSPEQICQAIKDLYAGGSPMSPEIARRVVAFFPTTSAKLESLTDREIEILDSISREATYKDAAAKIGVSPATIRNHLHHIYKKLQVKNKTEAVNKLLNRSE